MCPTGSWVTFGESKATYSLASAGCWRGAKLNAMKVLCQPSRCTHTHMVSVRKPVSVQRVAAWRVTSLFSRAARDF